MSLSWKRIVPGAGLAATLSIVAVPGMAVAAPDTPADNTAGIEAPEDTPSNVGDEPSVETPDPTPVDPDPTPESDPIAPEPNPEPEPSPEPAPEPEPEPEPTEPGEPAPPAEEPGEEPSEPVDPVIDETEDPEAGDEDTENENPGNGNSPSEGNDPVTGPPAHANPGGGHGNSRPAPRQEPPPPAETRKAGDAISNISSIAEREARTPRPVSNIGRSIAGALYRSAAQQELSGARVAPTYESRTPQRAVQSAPQSSDASDDRDELAHTGASMEYQAALAAGLLAFGAGAIAASRRRQA